MGEIITHCKCSSEEPKTDMILTTNSNDKRLSTLRDNFSLSSKYNDLKRQLTTKFRSSIFQEISDNDSAIKIQSAYRGYIYRITKFPDLKAQLLSNEKDMISNLNNKYITPKLIENEKLFETKEKNPELKHYFNEIYESMKFSKQKTSDKTERINSNTFRANGLKVQFHDIPSYYVGTVNNNNEPHGEGILYTEDGCKYDGNFYNGNFSGYGKFINNLGHCYEGIFENGLLNGQGSKIISNDHYYYGNFKDGELNGNGKEKNLKFSYEGNFVDGKKNGLGKIQFLNSQEKYEGEFTDDNITGNGFYKWENGHTYHGNFVNGIMSGKGIYKWTDGSSYEGEYINGIREGKGIFTFKDGKKYTGLFKQGKPDGEGILTIKGVDVEVEYENGKIISNLKDSFMRKISNYGSEY